MRYGVAALLGMASLAVGEATDPSAQTGPPALQAGFARTDITPSLGAEIPGGFGKNRAQGVHDSLWVEAAYIAGNGTEAAVVAVDALFVPDDVVQSARMQAHARCGIPPENVLIAASHTHNGGPIVDCFGSDRDPQYCAAVAEGIAEAVAQARQRAQPARVGAGVGHEDTVAFNRRFHMKDGTERTHPGKMNPDIVGPAGPMDPEVAVVAFQNDGGEILGCLVNHALHATVLGGREFSADWPHYVRETLRAVLGTHIGVVFLNGACGDVTQVDNRNPRGPEFGEAWARRVGMTVGAEALKVVARLEYAEAAPVAVAREVLELPIRDLGESDDELVDREDPGYGLGSGNREVFLREAALVREMKARTPAVSVEVQAVRIGGAVLVANPTEYFCALGLDVKARSPWDPTVVVELANGYAGYCPTEQAFRGGGYETRTARSSFLAPGAGEAIADASVRLLEALAAGRQHSAPPMTLP